MDEGRSVSLAVIPGSLVCNLWISDDANGGSPIRVSRAPAHCSDGAEVMLGFSAREGQEAEVRGPAFQPNRSGVNSLDGLSLLRLDSDTIFSQARALDCSNEVKVASGFPAEKNWGSKEKDLSLGPVNDCTSSLDAQGLASPNNTTESRSKLMLSQISQFSEVASSSSVTLIPWRNNTNEASFQPSTTENYNPNSWNDATSLLFDQEVQTQERDLQASIQSQMNEEESELVITENEVYTHASSRHPYNIDNITEESEKQQIGSTQCLRNDAIPRMPDGVCDTTDGLKTEDFFRYKNLSLSLANENDQETDLVVTLGQKKFSFLPPPDEVVSKYYTSSDSVYAVGDEKAFVLKQEYRKSSQESEQARIRKRTFRRDPFSMTVISSDKDEKCHVLLSKGFPCVVRFPEEAYLSIPSSELFNETLVPRRSPRLSQRSDEQNKKIGNIKKEDSSNTAPKKTIYKAIKKKELPEVKMEPVNKKPLDLHNKFWTGQGKRTLLNERAKYFGNLSNSQWRAVAKAVNSVEPVERSIRACMHTHYFLITEDNAEPASKKLSKNVAQSRGRTEWTEKGKRTLLKERAKYKDSKGHWKDILKAVNAVEPVKRSLNASQQMHRKLSQNEKNLFDKSDYNNHFNEYGPKRKRRDSGGSNSILRKRRSRKEHSSSDESESASTGSDESESSSTGSDESESSSTSVVSTENPVVMEPSSGQGMFQSFLAPLRNFFNGGKRDL